MANEANTIWIKGFSADGFQVSVTLSITDASQITSVLDQVRAQGIQPTPPAAQPATERMTITSLTRRLWTGKDGKEKHALDFFVDHLQWRVFTVYMDSMDDIEAFEAGSGLQIGGLPVLPISAPPERNQADKNQIPCSFDVLYNIEHTAEGKRRDVFVGYAETKAPAPAPSPKVAPMPAPQKDDPSVANHTPAYKRKPEKWTEDRKEADMFNAACRRRGVTPIHVLKHLEPGKELTSFRDISLSREDAYLRLVEIATKPAIPTTSSMIDDVVADRSKATAASPLAPDGFRTSNIVDDVPF